MPNFYGVPEISIHEVASKLHEQDDFLLLDVREDWEIQLASLDNPRVAYTPLSQLAYRGQAALPPAALDKEAEIVVVCHHGVRSAEVTAWLLQQGWKNVRSLEGGLEAYALYVDPNTGRY